MDDENASKQAQNAANDEDDDDGDDLKYLKSPTHHDDSATVCFQQPMPHSNCWVGSASNLDMRMALAKKERMADLWNS